MKKFVIFLLFIIGLVACKKDANETAYDKSYKALLSFKAASKNSYTYVVYGGSAFGYYSETKITVQNGVVVARDYSSFILEDKSINGTGLKLTDQWHEDKNSLNQHIAGAAPINLGQVYKKAKNEWLKADKKKNTIYFETNNNGMISNASYVPIGCQDDCSVGIAIKEIKAL